jgi:hypothetical protein
MMRSRPPRTTAGVLPIAEGDAEIGSLTATKLGGFDTTVVTAQIVAALGL